MPSEPNKASNANLMQIAAVFKHFIHPINGLLHGSSAVSPVLVNESQT